MLTQIVIGAQPQAAGGILGQPVLLAAIITFTGVLLTVIIGTAVNFKLAKRRNDFEQQLARDKFEHDKELASQKLSDDRAARHDARSRELNLRRIDFHRDNLVNIQEAMHTLTNAAHRILHIAQANPDNNLSWSMKISAANKDTNITQLYTKVLMYEHRAISDEVRELSSYVRRNAGIAKLKSNAEEAESAVSEAKKGFLKFVALTGEQIRGLDKLD